MIKVVGLGPGAWEALTLGTLQILKSTTRIYLRTSRHPNVEYLSSLGLTFQTYDEKYDTLDNFDDVYNSIAENLISEHEIYKDIVYAVPGHPLVAERSVIMLLDLCKKKNIEIKIFPAVSFIDAMMEALKIDAVEGLKVIDAFDIKNQLLDKRVATIITQVYNKFICSDVKLALLEYYKDDTEVYFVRAAGVKGQESIRKVLLYEIDRQDDIDHLTSLFIPKDLDNTKDFYDLLEIMDILRGEEGCPWDMEQSHESLKKCLIEECYEVLEAIDDQDENMLVEELGDVLLQVVFHARIGKEQGYFNISDIIKGICNKMIERHPHIFGDVKVNNSEEVLVNWEEIKKKEKGFENHTQVLKHVPKNLPALMRAEKVQKKAKLGSDLESFEENLTKVINKLNNMRNVYKSKERSKLLEEVGDLMFSSVNLSRFLDIDPEVALNYTIDKFISRFEFIEKSAVKTGIKLEEMSSQQMDILWDEFKSQ